MANGPDELGQEELAPSPRLHEMIGEIPFKPWQCFAELIDNSFDEFLRDVDRNPVIRRGSMSRCLIPEPAMRMPLAWRLRSERRTCSFPTPKPSPADRG